MDVDDFATNSGRRCGLYVADACHRSNKPLVGLAQEPTMAMMRGPFVKVVPLLVVETNSERRNPHYKLGESVRVS